jgi:hypothetical protein
VKNYESIPLHHVNTAYGRSMRKPHHGDELTIRYAGEVFRARCDGITEHPDRGLGAANFSIVSTVHFERGGAAQLLKGPEELAINVLRVTPVGHHRARKLNIVMFTAAFDGTTPVIVAKTSPRPSA